MQWGRSGNATDYNANAMEMQGDATRMLPEHAAKPQSDFAVRTQQLEPNAKPKAMATQRDCSCNAKEMQQKHNGNAKETLRECGGDVARCRQRQPDAAKCSGNAMPQWE